ACRNGGPSGALRLSVGSCFFTHSSSTSANTTACAVKPQTPASLAEGWGRTVTPPSAGGDVPAAAFPGGPGSRSVPNSVKCSPDLSSRSARGRRFSAAVCRWCSNSAVDGTLLFYFRGAERG